MMLIVAMVVAIGTVTGKIYERCELARELRYKHGAPESELGTWVCIAEHESQYNTSAVGHMNADESGDHGIFQISDLFWCSPPGKGWACDVTCADLEDEDIADDFECARKIHREHEGLSGNGFSAWAVYEPLCKGRSEKYLEDCFEVSTSPVDIVQEEVDKMTTTTREMTTTTTTEDAVKIKVVEDGHLQTLEVLPPTTKEDSTAVEASPTPFVEKAAPEVTTSPSSTSLPTSTSGGSISARSGPAQSFFSPSAFLPMLTSSEYRQMRSRFIVNGVVWV